MLRTSYHIRIIHFFWMNIKLCLDVCQYVVLYSKLLWPNCIFTFSWCWCELTLFSRPSWWVGHRAYQEKESTRVKRCSRMSNTVCRNWKLAASVMSTVVQDAYLYYLTPHVQEITVRYVVSCVEVRRGHLDKWRSIVIRKLFERWWCDQVTLFDDSPQRPGLRDNKPTDYKKMRCTFVRNGRR